MRRQQCLVRVLPLVVTTVCALAVPAIAEDCPELIGRSDGMGRVDAVAASEGYAYVVGSGLTVIDVSDPSAPVRIGFLDKPSDARDVAVSDRHAYVVGYESDPPTEGTGLWVIDLTQPSIPTEVGFVETPGSALDVAVSGRYAYVVGGRWPDWGYLQVIDVSAPSAPVEVGLVGTPSTASGVAVADGFAYVAEGNGSLRVIDMSTPSAPVEVGFLEGAGSAVAVEGHYAYVAGHAGFGVIDVSTPAAPVEVGRFQRWRVFGEDVAVSGGYAYLAAEIAGLHVIDVNVPSRPVQVGWFDTGAGGSAVGVAVSSGSVYVAASGAGLYTFSECPGPFRDARESFFPAAAVAAGAQGGFFQTDVEINNTGAEEAQVSFEWLPRGEDNSTPTQSDLIALAAGQSLRYENVLTELFGLSPDSLGALKMVASTESVIGMSRTYNVPGSKTAGTFGQGLPAVRATEMLANTGPQRIVFLSEDFNTRANVGCVNGSSEPVSINIELFDSLGESLETKTMNLAPYSNDQINRIFGDHQLVSGYVDVWADSLGALYYCYGSVLDSLTSDPTTILPQVPSSDMIFIPGAALAAGLKGSYFRTDLELNNFGRRNITYELLWLPRGADNRDPVRSDTFSLARGTRVRYANVLGSVFGLEPDLVGGLAVEASGPDLLAMSRTYNLPSAKVAGTFGQELPGIPAHRMITAGQRKRIIFMNENDDVRSNLGCQNGSDHAVRVFIELFNAQGESLETRTMDLAPYSNNQITRLFRSHSPMEAGYVDVWTDTDGASIYCYGSVLDNVTSDPTTVLPQ